jgi:hypothetical protein
MVRVVALWHRKKPSFECVEDAHGREIKDQMTRTERENGNKQEQKRRRSQMLSRVAPIDEQARLESC